jgi:hypothetical protein
MLNPSWVRIRSTGGRSEHGYGDLDSVKSYESLISLFIITFQEKVWPSELKANRTATVSVLRVAISQPIKHKMRLERAC